MDPLPLLPTQWLPSLFIPISVQTCRTIYQLSRIPFPSSPQVSPTPQRSCFTGCLHYLPSHSLLNLPQSSFPCQHFTKAAHLKGHQWPPCCQIQWQILWLLLTQTFKLLDSRTLLHKIHFLHLAFGYPTLSCLSLLPRWPLLLMILILSREGPRAQSI